MLHPLRIRALVPLCAAALATLAAGSLTAQGAMGEQFQFRPRLGAGYVSNIPNQFVGISGHVLSGRAGGIGLYVDVKFDLESPADEQSYIDDLTAAEVEDELGHRLIRRDGSWTTINVALMRPLAPQFVLYAGAGYSDGNNFREYVDESGQMGTFGHYWVRDEEASGPGLNLMGGAMLQIAPSLALQLGGESRPGGFTVGVSYLMPR
jgi:hypothetical protein